MMANIYRKIITITVTDYQVPLRRLIVLSLKRNKLLRYRYNCQHIYIFFFYYHAVFRNIGVSMDWVEGGGVKPPAITRVIILQITLLINKIKTIIKYYLRIIIIFQMLFYF